MNKPVFKEFVLSPAPGVTWARTHVKKKTATQYAQLISFYVFPTRIVSAFACITFAMRTTRPVHLTIL